MEERRLGLGFEKIRFMDTAVADYHGRPALVCEKGVALVEREFKNLAEASLLGSKDLGQLAGKVDAASKRAGGKGASRATIERELERMEYVLRGGENRFPGLRLQIVREIETHLPPEAKDLASRVQILFQSGKTLPF